MIEVYKYLSTDIMNTIFKSRQTNIVGEISTYLNLKIPKP